MNNSWWAIAISACALVFTVSSFWWIQVRRGRLQGYAPHSFAALVDGSLILFLRFPVVIHNTGAMPIVVLDLRLRFPDEPSSVVPLRWRTSRTQLTPSINDGERFPGVFAVQGRNAEQHFIEFGGPWPGFVMQSDSEYRCLIEAKLGHNGKWRKLVEFPLILPRMADPSSYTTYSNSPWEPTSGDRAKIEAVSRELMRRLVDFGKK